VTSHLLPRTFKLPSLTAYIFSYVHSVHEFGATEYRNLAVAVTLAFTGPDKKR